jgi:hypothetical protein
MKDTYFIKGIATEIDYMHISLDLIRESLSLLNFQETFIGKESEPEARRVEYCLVMQKLGLFFQFFFKHYLNNLDYFEKFFKYFLTSFPKVSCFEWLLLQYHLGNLEIFKEEGGGYKLIFCTFTEFNLKKFLDITNCIYILILR